jgi:hypothetical protein
MARQEGSTSAVQDPYHHESGRRSEGSYEIAGVEGDALVNIHCVISSLLLCLHLHGASANLLIMHTQSWQASLAQDKICFFFKKKFYGKVSAVDTKEPIERQ